MRSGIGIAFPWREGDGPHPIQPSPAMQRPNECMALAQNQEMT